jgi:hypothetical protein
MKDPNECTWPHTKLCLHDCVEGCAKRSPQRSGWRKVQIEDALKEALAQPEQEPAAYLVLFEGAGKLLEFTKGNYLHGAKIEHIPLYTHPATAPVIDKSAAIRIATALGWTPPRTWVGLTDDDDIDWEEGGNLRDLVKAIEAKLKDKNGYAVEKNT